jgi:hypothetical protein
MVSEIGPTGCSSALELFVPPFAQLYDGNRDSLDSDITDYREAITTYEIS